MKGEPDNNFSVLAPVVLGRFVFSKQLTLVLDDCGGSAVLKAVVPPQPEGAVLHSSGGLQHHGGETYLHGLWTSVTSRICCVYGICRNAPWTSGGFFYVYFLPTT